MLLPPHCVVCRTAGAPLCGGCAGRLAPPPPPRPAPDLDATVALFAYQGAGRQVIAALKFANHRDALEPLSTHLAAALAAATAEPVQLVTWVPTSAARRRRRGYDQAELIARVVARTLQVPAAATVRRLDAGSQARRGRLERVAVGVRAFESRRLVPPVVAVVDDVRTTGASLTGVARALRRSGAASVVGATLAATP